MTDKTNETSLSFVVSDLYLTVSMMRKSGELDKLRTTNVTAFNAMSKFIDDVDFLEISTESIDAIRRMNGPK